MGKLNGDMTAELSGTQHWPASEVSYLLYFLISLTVTAIPSCVIFMFGCMNSFFFILLFSLKDFMRKCKC